MGAIHAVADLRTGETDPVVKVTVDPLLTDVSDCAWDPGNDTFLVYSATRGIYRAERAGTVAQVFTPSAGYTFGRVAWVLNP